ncbi:metal/formaldehyde-sensitive transcriptional repressor [Rhizobium bangladeshense]|uniref:metal/formaldehyde-sensitive transcriptional repressor n=1 Tax=Rhizobium TaxID=379 RepID=UPI001D68786B|nr:metal/formaldehyde-sensitive transcriptional repressor [Rhizobium bangladeshense]MBX5217114.1 metal/formaldehyde-sensitive transcriptional repressor [Rhizobium sp. NLR9a]MBX5222466.1 metal/formaldehyde-sensitive transcriptional repressor [Rhizobium sp. NLR8a]MBX5233445.1 metal/formaldehyde-sensitive transcriptional repressor [Rhizobium sp. NLR4a]MBX5239780.1 metal/formaldehyde-sensitive transcriptional repressor [Rhizobium sp. NLR22b]MBX5245489.1 metal/formaldehyde-sensitive transcriptional
MSHPTLQKKKLVARVSRLKGRLEAVERALEAERPCGEILQLLASIRGALTGLTSEVLDDHLRPGHHAAIVAIVTPQPHEPAFYKGRLSALEELSHVTVEVTRAA